MNHLQVFLNVRIKDLKVDYFGRLSEIGNLLLAPLRFFFSGKTVVIEHAKGSGLPKKDGNIAKVSSFFVYKTAASEPPYTKSSKQNPSLRSTGWGFSAAIITTPLVQLLLLVPCTLIGVIFKALSYFSPVVRTAHNTVKKKLTAKEGTIAPIGVTGGLTLISHLRAYLQTGQKTSVLTIQSHQEENSLSEECLGIIRDINPDKLILMGNWKKEDFDVKKVLCSKQNKTKWKSWDCSALDEHPQKPVNRFDYSVPKSKVVSSEQEARNFSPSWFGPKHTMFVVKIEGPEKPNARIQAALNTSAYSAYNVPFLTKFQKPNPLAQDQNVLKGQNVLDSLYPFNKQ